MKQEELMVILDNHKKWLDGDGGNCADLCGADLCGADLRGADLCGANLRGADLCGADLRGANLRDANLINANLRDANLRGADLCGADLCGADLRDANLRDANLINANLRDANLINANLCGANLRGADLWGCAGERNRIKSIFVSDVYAITYTSEHLQIGCQRHKIAEWWDFDDRKIAEMDGKTALKFWREWKDTIRNLIEKSPAN